jgi:hypothetical protein
VISDAGWSKLDFAERDKYRPVNLRLSLAINLGKKAVMFLYGTEWREHGFRLGKQLSCLIIELQFMLFSKSNIF